MQLTLSSPPFAKPSMAHRPVPKTVRSQDSTGLAQLDQIAAQNLQGSRHGLGASAMLLALVGGLVILGSASMWNGSADEPRKPAAALAEARVVPLAQAAVSKTAETVAPAVAQTVPQAAAAVSLTPSMPPMPFIPETAVASVAPAEPVAAADEAARKARAKQIADARRKAAQASQQQALAEESERLQLAQQREAEREQQQHQLAEQARQRAAADQARLASVQLAVNTRRGVAESCAAAGGFVGQQFCRSRECGKSEHQSDAVCVRLRDTEFAQQRASNER